MAKGRSKQPASWEWRVFCWVLLTVFWRLPKCGWRLLAWLFRRVANVFHRGGEQPETADGFYRSHKWRRLRVDALEANRQRYGMLACECCGMVNVAAFHVDHIYPRSTHPELALDPDNLQVLCEDCNIGKGTSYTTNWRGGDGPTLPRSRGLARFFLR